MLTANYIVATCNEGFCKNSGKCLSQNQLFVMLDGRKFVVHFSATPTTRVVVAATRVKVQVT